MLCQPFIRILCDANVENHLDVIDDAPTMVNDVVIGGGEAPLN